MREYKGDGIVNTLISMSGLYLFQRKVNGLPLPSIIMYIFNHIFRFVEIIWGGVRLIISKTVNREPRKKGSQEEYTLAIVAIAKNEREYLREWVAFHKVIGVEKIYLYDNESTDDMISTIEDFISEGFVTVIEIPGSKQQFNAYNDAIRRFGTLCKYMAFIDCDEYLMPSKEGDSIVPILDRIFQGSRLAGGIAVNWRMYGSSGYINKPEGMCIECFVYRARTEDGPGNKCIKTILKPSTVKKFAHAHFPLFKLGYCNINQFGIPVPGYMNLPTDADPLRINHYFTKSRAQWIERRSLGKADSSGKRTIDEFNKHDNNDIKDDIAAKYANTIRKLYFVKR